MAVREKRWKDVRLWSFGDIPDFAKGIKNFSLYTSARQKNQITYQFEQL